MSTNFDWSSDDESSWEEKSPNPPDPKNQGKHRLSPRQLVIAGIIFIGVFGSYIGLKRAADDTELRAIKAVIDSHRLYQLAASEADLELLSTVLAERPTSWRQMQFDLSRQDLLVSRAPLGIWLLNKSENDDGVSQQSVSLSSDYLTADVSDRRSYLTKVTQGVTETFTLERTYHYLWQGETWLASPIDDEESFWGPWKNQADSIISIIYPQRDQDVAQYLAPKLNELVVGICQDPRIACPNDFELRIKFDRTDRSLLRMGEGYYSSQLDVAYGGTLLHLPAPSLVGKPIDESGFEALFRGYASWIAAKIVLTYALDPISDDQEISDILMNWNLVLPPDPAPILPLPIVSSLPPIGSLPHQDILMLCSNEQRLSLLRLDILNNKWLAEASISDNDFSDDGTSFYQGMITRLTSNKAIAIQVAKETSGRVEYHSYIWRDDSLIPLHQEENPFFIIPKMFQSFTGSNPRYELVYRPSIDDASQGIEPWLMDVEQCLSESCELVPLAGFPKWSPDKRKTLIESEQSDGDLMIYLGNENGQVLRKVGPGLSPIWLDDQSFAFIDNPQISSVVGGLNSHGQSLVQKFVDGRVAAGDDGVILVDSESIMSELGPENRKLNIGIVGVSMFPLRRDHLLLSVTTMAFEQQHVGDYLISFNLNTKQLKILRRLSKQISYPQFYDESGRYLAIMARDESTLELYLLDTLTEELIRVDDLYPSDWSEDGKWFVFVKPGSLKLVAPFDDISWTVQHGLKGCDSAIWIGNESNLP